MRSSSATCHVELFSLRKANNKDMMWYLSFLPLFVIHHMSLTFKNTFSFIHCVYHPRHIIVVIQSTNQFCKKQIKRRVEGRSACGKCEWTDGHILLGTLVILQVLTINKGSIRIIECDRHPINRERQTRNPKRETNSKGYRGAKSTYLMNGRPDKERQEL